MSIQNVVLLGADGKLGPAILRALLSKSFQVTVLKRASSKSSDAYPNGVKVAKVQDDFAVDAVAECLSGHDAVVVTFKGSQVDIQEKVALACVKAGVRRLIPADFGSCDSSSEWTQSLVPLYKRKTELRDRLIQLAKDSTTFTWTSLVCGHFFDWDPEFLHFSVKDKKVQILDDGKTKWSASTLSQIGEATARILLYLDATQNQVIYVQSVCITQNQFVRALERATGSPWNVERLDSKQYQKEEKEKADNGDLEAIENLVWMCGTLDANWESRDTFAMKTLGLENEDLDAVVKRVVKENQ